MKLKVGYNGTFTIKDDDGKDKDVLIELPKDMPIPRIGEKIFAHNMTGVVENVNYHLNKRGKLFAVFVRTRPLYD